MFCPNCGTSVQEGTKFCVNCGAAAPAPFADQQPAQAPSGQYQAPPPQYPAPPPQYGPQAPPCGAPAYYAVPPKSGGIAAILAFLIPGLGHIYLGKIGEGIIYIILGVAIWIIGVIAVTIVGIATLGFGFIIGIVVVVIIYLAFWAWQIYDAYNKTNQYNAAVRKTGRAPW